MRCSNWLESQDVKDEKGTTPIKQKRQRKRDTETATRTDSKDSEMES
jgi:hypothetical protein